MALHILWTVQISSGHSVHSALISLPTYYFTFFLNLCDRLALANSQMLTQLLAQSPLLVGWGRKIEWESSWVKIMTGTLLINLSCRQSKLDIGKINWIYCQLKYIQVVRNKDKHWNKTFAPSPCSTSLWSPLPLPEQHSRLKRITCILYIVVSLLFLTSHTFPLL